MLLTFAIYCIGRVRLDDICLTVLSAANYFCSCGRYHGKLIVTNIKKVDRRLVTTSIAN